MRVRAERESCGRGEVGRGGFPALPCDRPGISGGVQPLAARVAGRILCLHGGLGAGLVDIDQIRALQRRAAARRRPWCGGVRFTLGAAAW